MAPIPFRRRGKLAKAQNPALAKAALALARDRMGSGSSRGKRRGGRKLLLGGVLAAAAGAALWKRDKVAGLLPSRTGDEYEPQAPGPSNYDAPGPVANTATPVPVPEPANEPPIDEAAEEAAAAAEAANIGGTVSDYAGPTDLHATEAERPLEEAGEGESEGFEQADFALEQAAEPTAPGMSDTERQIDDAIEAAENPAIGERVEPLKPGDERATVDEPAPFAGDEDEAATDEVEAVTDEAVAEADEAVADESAADSGEATVDEAAADDEATLDEAAADEEAAAEEPAAESDESKAAGGEDETKGNEGGSDWRTWSGRSVNP
jgi:hypothetical protein